MRSHPNGGMSGVNNPSSASAALGKFDINDQFFGAQEHPVTSPSGAIGALGTMSNWPIANTDPLQKHVLAHVTSDYVTNFATDISGNNWENYTSLTNTANGARLSLMGPNTEYWCSEFNNVDTMTFADNASHQLGTGVFTIECWFIVTTNATAEYRYIASRGVAATSGWGLAMYGSQQVRFDFGNTSATITGTSAIKKGQWNFLQVIRNNTGTNGCEMFVNGTSIGTFTCATNFNDSTVGYIGTDRGNALPFNGYLADIRVSKVVRAVGTPTAPLVSDANTAFLALPIQSRTSNMIGGTVTARGGWCLRNKVTPFVEPYTGTIGSLWVDGTVANAANPQISDTQTGNTSLRFTGDFTAECWFYANNANLRMAAMSKGTATTGWELLIIPQSGFNGSVGFVDNATVNLSTTTLNISPGSWNHAAVVRSGSGTNNVSIYINGTKVYSCTATTSYTGTDAFKIGQTKGTASSNNWNGGLSQVKLSNAAIYSTTFTPATILTAGANTVYLGLTTATSPEFDTLLDVGFSNGIFLNTVSRYVSKTSPFTDTGWSLYNNAANDSGYYVTNNTNFDFSTGNFSIEFFHLTKYTWDQSPRNLIDTRANVNSSADTGYAVRLGPNATVEFIVKGSNTILASTTRFVQDVWMHVCIQRLNGALALFVNGVQEASCMYTSALTSAANPKFASYGPTGQYGMYGYLSNVRILKGDVPYKKNIAGTVVNPTMFPIPTSTLTAISSTVFLSFCGPMAKDYATPSTANVMTVLDVNGSAGMCTVAPFKPNQLNSSVGAVWDNTGSQVTNVEISSVNKNYLWMLTGAPFTIDFWLLATFSNNATPSPTTIISTGYGASSCAFEIVTDGSGTANTALARALTFKVAGVSAWQFALTGTAALVWDSWNHVSIVYDGTTLSMYTNGTRVNTTATSFVQQTATGTSSNLNVGSNVAEFRISNIARTATSNTTMPVPTAPYTVDANTHTLLNRTSTMYDVTGRSCIYRDGGTARLSPGVKKFGTAAIAFTQDRAAASIVDRFSLRGSLYYWDSYNFATRFGDFTIEFWAAWAKSTAPNGNVFFNWYNIKLLASATGKWSFAYTTALTVDSNIPVALNSTFQHIAIVKRGNIYNVFVDGVLACILSADITETTVSRNDDANASAANPMMFGSVIAGTLATAWAGYVQDIRFTGVARYRPGIVNGVSTMIDIITGLPGVPTGLLPTE